MKEGGRERRDRGRQFVEEEGRQDGEIVCG